ncbi:MAG: hypothetical protein JWM80_518 [Cyanobacteria bacterium RYN_339]|nr:hypothetical protein [Cyanobacteria bacterium RYN_339]
MDVRPIDGTPRATPPVPAARPPQVQPARVEGDRRLAAAGDRPLSTADHQLLDQVTAAHLQYFLDHRNLKTGLVADSSAPGAPASVAAVGFALTSYGVAVHRGLLPREQAAHDALLALRTLANAPQGRSAGAAGYHGFFYHFMDPRTATRAGTSEVSTVDTALLMGGVLFARNFFDADSPEEREIRALSTKLYQGVDWNWALAGKDTLSMGWSPDKPKLGLVAGLFDQAARLFSVPGQDPGFIPYRWGGYNEGMLMVLLGMGSPTHPLPASAWQAYHRSDGRAKDGSVPFGPMFGHQYSQAWVDFRGINDAASKARGFDWAENSRRATLAQHAYAVRNPQGFAGYGPLDWGITASEGPGKITKWVDGKLRAFLGYFARGAPSGKDDGTLAPTAVAASLPFAPEIVLPTLHHWRATRPELWGRDGFADAFNPTFDRTRPSGWVAPTRLGIDQGPIVLMTENFRSGFVWDVMKRDPDLRRGLERAGFTGGWLAEPH